MRQVCPVCSGTGKVSRPAGVAGDQPTWVSASAGPWDCRACAGSGLIDDGRCVFCSGCGWLGGYQGRCPVCRGGGVRLTDDIALRINWQNLYYLLTNQFLPANPDAQAEYETMRERVEALQRDNAELPVAVNVASEATFASQDKRP